ncbi:MAG TPA: peptidyl-alpha-hydroxyglycine alpha-amidating lyase family protein [Verrucomicrobiae bacterium]|nr:peptidyl-alpha-hydroxyglycine alpha-amidating lyase family protein [Verrucomicrobiae bacterium]
MSISVAPKYQAVVGWERLPADYTHPDVAGVAVNSTGRVYFLCRAEHPILIYERDGSFVGSWGEGQISTRAHGLTIAPDDSVWCIDHTGHSVRKFTPDGKLLLTLGDNAGKPSESGYDGSNLTTITHGAPPFNRPTNLAVAQSGDIYVADGYGNARVHRFSANGKLLASWGEPGTGPGQFMLPHAVAVDRSGNVFVCDRESDRIQIFTGDGRFLREITDIQRPTQIVLRRGLMYVSELGWRAGERSFRNGPIARDMHPRISVLDETGAVITRLGGPDPCAPGSFCAPHGLAVDSNGDLYVAEVVWTIAGKEGLVPPDCHTVQKLALAA